MKTVGEFSDACKDVLVEVTGDRDVEITHLTNDSRQVRSGSLFVAIQGELADGRDYIPQALEKGAVAVLYKGDDPLELSVPSIRVSDDYVACGLAAEFFYDYPAKRMLKIGITGTNGKTTTAYILREIFRHAGRKTGLIGTVVYDLGDREVSADRTTPTPLELQGMLAEMRDNGVQMLIMEVSSHALCQKRMGSMVFDVAAFSNLTPEHLDYHGDMENYYQAKKKLFTEFLKRGGAAVLNFDDEYGRRLEEELSGRTLGYGFAEGADVHPTSYEMDIDGTVLHLTSGDMRSPLIGDYNASNVMCAAACAWSCGIGEDDIREAVEHFAGVPGRLERVPNDTGISVFVDYAHTSDALVNVLKCVRPLCENKMTVVFGCGGNRDKTKRPVMAKVAAELSDRIVITSDNPRDEDPDEIIRDILVGLPDGADSTTEPDRAKAIRIAVEQAEPGDTIVIAGKGHEDYQLIAGVKHPYNDFDAAKAALAGVPAATV